MHQSTQTDVGVAGDRLTVTVRGRLTAEAIVDIVRTHYGSFHGRQILWNLIAADFSGFAKQDFIRIAETVRDHTRSDVMRKTAYVAPHQAALVLLWQYLNQGFRVHVPVEYKTFTDIGEAERWLTEP